MYETEEGEPLSVCLSLSGDTNRDVLVTLTTTSSSSSTNPATGE